MNIAFFIGISCILLGGIEYAKRQFSLSVNMTRRVTHVGSALIAVAAPLFVSREAIIIACLVFAAAIAFARRTTLFSSIHDIGRVSYGDICLPLGEAIAAAIFLPQSIEAFQYGVLIMGVADPVAGLVGERFGRHQTRFFGVAKSLEGSFTFFVMALLITTLFVPILSYGAILVATILTLAEFLAGRGTDNLILPILGAYLIHLIV